MKCLNNGIAVDAGPDILLMQKLLRSHQEDRHGGP